MGRAATIAAGVVAMLLLAACHASAPLVTESVAALPSSSPGRSVTVERESPTPKATATPSPTATPAIPPSVSCEWTLVSGVDDGDTFRITGSDGAEDRVRLIGVDAPEGGKPLSAEAKQALTDMLGSRSCLESDTTDRDRFGRLLRYAWAGSGVLVNEALVRQGLAVVATFPPDIRYLAEKYQPAEDLAKGERRGLWGLAATATPATPDVTKPAANPSPAVGADCDASYPDVCIPPVAKAGDLDCADVPYRRFRVLPPDPHRFDADKNGIGCESG